MDERRDFNMHASRGAFIPLWRAAAIAYKRLFPDMPEADASSLDVIELAMSALIPLYRRDERTDNVTRLSDAQIATGRIGGGAMHLTFADGKPPVGSLMVSVRQLESALEKFQVSSIDAGRASLTLRQSPKSGPAS